MSIHDQWQDLMNNERKDHEIIDFLKTLSSRNLKENANDFMMDLFFEENELESFGYILEYTDQDHIYQFLYDAVRNSLHDKVRLSVSHISNKQLLLIYESVKSDKINDETLGIIIKEVKIRGLGEDP